MSYRPPSRQPRGSWARHLHEQRRLRDLSQTQAFEAVYERIGWSPKSRTAYVAIDMGERQPRPDEAAVLGIEFGWPPDPQDLPEGDDQPLAAAIRELTAELRASREARADVEARLATLEPVVARLAARALEDNPGHGAPLGSMG